MTIASLMVKLGIEGADTVKRGLSDTKAEIRGVESAAERASPALQRMERTFAAMASAGAAFIAVQVGQNLFAGAKSAFDASVAYESLTARMEALTGSAQKTAEKLKFVQEVANPSNFTFSQLADAAVTLEAFGLRTERVLPSIARLGMAFAADNEHLRELVRLFGRLGTGDFPDMEVLSAFGLNKQQFKQKGVEFDGQGKMISDARTALDALEKIINEKYGGIFDKMKNTASAKLGSLTDAWEKFVRVVGDGIARLVVPALERLTTLINAMTSTGVLADMIDRIATSLERMTGATRGQGFQDGLTNIIASVAAFTANLPEYFRVMGENIMAIMKWIGDSIRVVIADLTGKNRPQDKRGYASELAVIDYQERFGEIDARAAAINRARLNRRFGVIEPFDPASLKLSKFPDTPALAAEYGEKMRGFKSPEVGIPQASGDFGKIMQDGDAAGEALKKIERNTRETADFLSLRQQTLGGGALAGLGVTAAEIASHRGANMAARYKPGFARNNVPGQGIDSEIARLIMETLRTMGHTTMRRA